MIKIVIDTRMIRSSGIGTYLQNLIPAIKKNYELILLGDEELIQSFEWSENIPVINFQCPIYSLKEQIVLPMKIPRCDFFLSPHYNIPVLPIKAKKRIVIIHDVYHLAFYNKLTGMQKLYARAMINLAARLSDRIITVSNFSKSEIVKYTHVVDSKIDIVYCGYDFTKFIGTSNEENHKIRNKYNLPGKYFLFVSNIKPHKNLYNLLSAFKIILEKDEKYKLVVVGEYKKLITADEEVFKLIISDSNLKKNTIFTGYVDAHELISIYKMAEALIFPSFYEGFGLPPLEAMACGCPVIASNAASISEACGDAALYFDPYSIENIAAKINHFINNGNVKNDLVQNGFQNIKRFSRENFSMNLIKIIDSLQ